MGQKKDSVVEREFDMTHVAVYADGRASSLEEFRERRIEQWVSRMGSGIIMPTFSVWSSTGEVYTVVYNPAYALSNTDEANLMIGSVLTNIHWWLKPIAIIAQCERHMDPKIESVSDLLAAIVAATTKKKKTKPPSGISMTTWVVDRGVTTEVALSSDYRSYSVSSTAIDDFCVGIITQYSNRQSSLKSLDDELAKFIESGDQVVVELSKYMTSMYGQKREPVSLMKH